MSGEADELAKEILAERRERESKERDEAYVRRQFAEAGQKFREEKAAREAEAAAKKEAKNRVLYPLVFAFFMSLLPIIFDGVFKRVLDSGTLSAMIITFIGICVFFIVLRKVLPLDNYDRLIRKLKVLGIIILIIFGIISFIIKK